MIRIILGLLALLWITDAQAQQVNVYCSTGSGFNTWQPASSTNPCPVTGTVTSTPHTWVSAGAQQNALAISTNTQLTVPAGTLCAQITVEVANIRRTSDGTSASSSTGTLIQQGASWQDCGPLAAYKFTAVSGSPTIDVEYFK